ncbi:sulfotransferase 1C2-like isoform X1 [Varroa jacobsoni]|uniref:Sulfotransferase domain-containing protein n=1 Tax=Varroa destructor TaxID=109461 RepID=A0A7M7JIR8_VARDE|nr:sulfotransferase 1C2-like [Varroa destructor]XP_022685727.1 sulfotransferase 1C2-like isoform X1 [Varroa jacobsoni]
MNIGDTLPGREERIVCLKPLYLDLDGTRLSKTFTIKSWREAISYQPRPDDVFVATFPKCGTTWTLEITYLLNNDGVPPADHLDRLRNNPFIEVTGQEGPRRMRRPGCIKTHLPRNLVPYSPQAKYIYVLRNPKDCVVSYFHHQTKTFSGYDFADGKFEDFFELFMAGEIEYNDYFTHLLSWYPQTKEDNTIFLHYEDIKKDPRSEILRLSKFMDENIYNKILTTDLLDKVIKNSSIDTMKKEFSKFEIPLKMVDDDAPGIKNFIMANIPSKIEDESVAKFPSFVREGRVGGWRDTLTPEMNARLEKKILEVLEPVCPDVVDKWRQHGILTS